jgi:SAM-dependent methyltransferase
MSIAWKIKARFYDKLVTDTRNKMLKNFIINEEKKLEDTLNNVIGVKTLNKPISLIEIGCGTGRTLFTYITKEKIWEHLIYLIGLDNSAAMFEISVRKLEDIKESFVFRSKRKEIDQKYIFLLMDVLDMNKYFKNGNIDVEALEKVGINDFVQKLNVVKYNNSVKVVCSLLNTLGVIIGPNGVEKAAEARQIALNNMVTVAGRGGKVIISVFSSESFISKAPKLYKSIEKLTGKFDRNSFQTESFEFRTKGYYSHWFEKREIIDMMNIAGCKNIDCKDISGELEGYLLTSDT